LQFNRHRKRRHFCKAPGRCNITEFNYRYFDPRLAQIFAGVSSTGLEADRAELVRSLREQGFSLTDMTENELAKEHIRYMVGGHSPCALNEVIYSVEFPERPGALLKFLTAMSGRWNIGLFHYRNYGAAFGQVLMGLQMPKEERGVFEQCLDALGFAYHEETGNLAYRLFAGGGELVSNRK
jgi:threonine dehydratase